MSKDKKVIVTGNQGFIGVWLTYKFYKLGYKVYGIDNRSSYGERLFDKAKLDNIVTKQYNEDISDIEKMKLIISEIEPDLIINMAGQAIVPRAFEQPHYTFMTNAVGTLSILEAAKSTKNTKSVICITSDKVYENVSQIWGYRETDKLGGKDIYSVSKSTAELISSCYARTHLSENGINIQTVRLGNVVGGGDWSVNRLIPDLMNSIQQKTNFYIRYLKATRPFQHVLDVVDGVYKISMASLENQLESGDCWNLGPKNNSYEVVENVIAMCKTIWPEVKILQNENNIKEDLTLSVDVSKLKHRFGEPKYESKEAIQKTFNWYRAYYDGNTHLIDLIEKDFETYEDKNEII